MAKIVVRTITIACMIPCQKLIVPNFIFIGVLLERDFWGNSCSESFYKTREAINEGLLISKVHGEVCPTACLNKIKVLKGKHFSVTLQII